MQFYLGTSCVDWLERAGVPLFYTYPYFHRRRSLPRALAPWALDSGGYNQLRKFGEWRITSAEYAAGVRRLEEETGRLTFACIQDWACAPPSLEATGLDVAEHQARTLRSYLELRDREPELPWAPVLQGWEVDDYHRHAEQHVAAGVDLTQVRVCVGSIATRQDNPMVGAMLRSFARDGLRLHGLGVKRAGLRLYDSVLASVDSQAWTFIRFSQEPGLPDCGAPGCAVSKSSGNRRCCDCIRYALAWRKELLEQLSYRREGQEQQESLFGLEVDEHVPGRDWGSLGHRKGPGLGWRAKA